MRYITRLVRRGNKMNYDINGEGCIMSFVYSERGEEITSRVVSRLYISSRRPLYCEEIGPCIWKRKECTEQKTWSNLDARLLLALSFHTFESMIYQRRLLHLGKQKGDLVAGTVCDTMYAWSSHLFAIRLKVQVAAGPSVRDYELV